MIYIFISLFIDLFLYNFIPYSYQNINMFYLEIFISSLPIAYLLIKNKKIFLCMIIVISVLYDFLFSDMVFINLYFFILYFMFLSFYYKARKPSFFNIFLISIIGVI